jgi:NAD(P)-dependent dehydrogenase (short-subunit alcohol dehydrogenase family)
MRVLRSRGMRRLRSLHPQPPAPRTSVRASLARPCSTFPPYVLINNAGVAIYDDLSRADVIAQHLAVNLLGLANVTNAFLPLLKRAKGAIVNNLSMAGLAPLPVIPAYSMSKAAAFNLTQSLRTLLASQGVSVHAVVLGPIDTDMNHGFEIPKASPEAAARGIFDGLKNGEEEDFSRSSFPVDRRGLARGREQGARARVQNVCAGEHCGVMHSCVTGTRISGYRTNESPDRREIVGALRRELYSAC